VKRTSNDFFDSVSFSYLICLSVWCCGITPIVCSVWKHGIQLRK